MRACCWLHGGPTLHLQVKDSCGHRGVSTSLQSLPWLGYELLDLRIGVRFPTGPHIFLSFKVRSTVRKFPAWHTKAAPNGKCCEGYIVPSRVTSSQMWKVCWNNGRLCWKTAKLFYFCHLKKLVRPETFGPYHVCRPVLGPIQPLIQWVPVSVTWRWSLICICCLR